MKNTRNLLVMVLFASLALVSCSDDDNGYLYDGDGARIYGFQNPTTRISYFEDIGTVQEDIPVIFIGGADGTPNAGAVNLTYSVNEAESTATEGVEFDFLDTSGAFTIPAGSTYTFFPLAVNTGNFSPAEPSSLVLDLVTTTTDGTTISEQNRTVTITFIGCLSNLANYTYDVTTVEDNGSVAAFGIQGLTLIDVNTFNTESVGRWNPPLGPLTFVDVCGVLTVPQQNLAGIYGNQVYTVNPGSVDSTTGDFTITYAITFSGVPTFYTNTYIKQ